MNQQKFFSFGWSAVFTPKTNSSNVSPQRSLYSAAWHPLLSNPAQQDIANKIYYYTFPPTTLTPIYQIQDCQRPEYRGIYITGSIQYASPRFGHKTCRGWYTYNNGCYYNPPPPPPVQVTVTAFICGSSNYNYWSGVLGSSEKNMIISEYRQFNYGGRCPEHNGFVYWQAEWQYQANLHYAHISNYALRLSLAWQYIIRPVMRQNATGNGENLPSHLYQLNSFCQNFTGRSNAYYVNQSGDKCAY